MEWNQSPIPDSDGDPAREWNQQFWVTLADPLTQDVFFACPATGDCSWDPPVGVFLLPRQAEGEWWEISDPSRGDRSYYYSEMIQLVLGDTLSGDTQWVRPSGNAFVIPLGLLQSATLPPPSPRRIKAKHPFIPSHLAANLPTRSSSAFTIMSKSKIPGPRPPPSPRKPLQDVSPEIDFGPRFLTPIKRSTPKPDVVIAAKAVAGPSMASYTRGGLLSAVEEGSGSGSGNETDLSDHATLWKRGKLGPYIPKAGVRSSSALGLTKEKRRSRDMSPVLEDGAAPSGSERGEPRNHGEQWNDDPEEIEAALDSPPRIDTFRAKRMSTGLHPLLPSEITSQIRDFQTQDFAQRYFATRRKGFLRSKLPLEQILQWQKSPITAPLLVHSKGNTKDAITVFKVIQHVMGDRQKPVEISRSTASSPGHSSSAAPDHGCGSGSQSSPSPLGNIDSPKSRGANGWSWSWPLARVTPVAQSKRSNQNGQLESEKPNTNAEKIRVLHEIQRMIELAVGSKSMRDEVYCQLIKQLSNNSDPEAVVLGFQLFSVIVNAFSPGEIFRMLVQGFLQKHLRAPDAAIGVMAQYCLGKLDSPSLLVERGRTLTLGEIEHASIQGDTHPESKIPFILPFLSEAILALGGLETEGIFRIPGDGDSVSALKARMDRGQYDQENITDPHVAASALKLWLRELREPIIPFDKYDAALHAAKSVTATIELVSDLPILHRRVLLFVISLLQLFLKEEVVEVTRMSANNLALIFAPNILRNTSTSLVTAYTNSTLEGKFVLHLLQHLDPSIIDSEFDPHMPYHQAADTEPRSSTDSAYDS